MGSLPTVEEQPALFRTGPVDDEARRRELARLGALEAELDAVEAALARLDAGTYGRCERCGHPIDDTLLADDPFRTSCGDDACGVSAASAPAG